MTDKKKLSKNLVLAIDWAAAEYKYLEDLRAELKKVEAEKEIKKELKELRKAAKILHYVARAERRAYEFEEKVGRELVELLPELQQEGISADLILGFRDLVTELGVEHDQLVKLASFYEGTLEKELDKARVEALLEAKVKAEHLQQAQQMHQAFLELVHHFSSQVEEAERWIAGLEATLKKAKKLFDNFSGYSKAVVGMEILMRENFPIPYYKDGAEFLALHPEDLREIEERERIESHSIFTYVLPSLAGKNLINETVWPYIMIIIKKFTKPDHRILNIKDFLSYIFPLLYNANIINKKNFPVLVRCLDDMYKVGLSNTHILLDIFSDATRLGGIDEKTLTIVVKDILEIYQGPGYVIYRELNLAIIDDCGYPGSDKKRWYYIVKTIFELMKLQSPYGTFTARSLKSVRPLIQRFGVALFDSLIFPTLQRQSVASSHCFEDYGNMEAAIQTRDDIDLLVKILNKRKFKAHDFFRHILISGIQTKVVTSPFSQEKQCLLSFLDSCSVDLLEIYTEYKRLLTSNHPEKMKHIEKMFKDLKTIKMDIFAGGLNKAYEEKIFQSILYSMFSPELTVPRESYQQVYDNRKDRQADVPAVIQKLSPEEVSISAGGYALKEGETVNDDVWKDLVEIVAEVNSKGAAKVVPELLGWELLEAFFTKQLAKERREYLRKIYAYWHQLGNSLPEFNADHAILMKYKEFVGDRLKNDLIVALIDAAYIKQQKRFMDLTARFEKPKNFTGLAKQLFGLYSSSTSDKEAKMKAILEKNGLHAPFDIQPKSWQELKGWLDQKATGTISKDLISNIFAMLIGEDYGKMQKEMEKFEHSHQATGKGGKKFIFMLSKRKVHSVAMFNMGVCVAPDDKLWNSPDFWQLIIWDEDHNAHGGIIYRTIEEQGKKYLILSIQPAGSILNEVSPVHLYDQLLAFSEKMRKKLDYDQILIPTNGAIHSNRGSIQAIISQRNYPKKKLLKEYDFSYTPYHYRYQEFFMVQ